MVTRREFLMGAATAAGAAILDLRPARGGPAGTDYFALHAFIEAHPDAVFIYRTNIAAKTDADAIRAAARALGNTLFVAATAPAGAFPVTGPVAIKPNLTSWSWDAGASTVPFEAKMGIQTDASFVEGIIGSLCDLSVPPSSIHIRDANFTAGAIDGAWYGALAQRTGVDLAQKPLLPSLPASDVVWTDVPGGIWYARIPYLWPAGAPGACLINIAKLKSHSMGMTLCSKNLQGTNARPYVAHCTAWNTPMSGVSASDIVPGAFTTIEQNYERHRETIPRWKTLDGDTHAGSAGGLWMETHTARCLDNNSALHPLLNIIEGVYGREGPFVTGPGPDGLGVDLMANLVIFGKNARHVDLVGAYLAGHEPGNFGLFHVARERGLALYLNPFDVPLYEWTGDGSAAAASLGAFSRTPIRTLYLPQAGERQYHMVDQPFDYGTTSAPRTAAPHGGPDALVIEQNFPNPFNPSTAIQYFTPRAGRVRLEIRDVRGALVDVPFDGHAAAGDHMVTWRAGARASGTYFYSILFEGVRRTRTMVLLR
ncbi:MAG TPA: DUF362 domain-containing protein [Bacteroidota bacterium]|nr:DUF362 domain-containing protein [Bacteroidota bacterium]